MPQGLPTLRSNRSKKGLIRREMELTGARREQTMFHGTLPHEELPLRAGEFPTGMAVIRSKEALARQQDLLAGRDVAAGIVARGSSRKKEVKSLRRGLRYRD